MSGAEALAVLSLLANLAGVVDFTLKALGRIKDTRDGARAIPKAFQDVETMLPLLTDALTKTKTQVKDEQLGEEFCGNVKGVLRECVEKIEELNGIFKECRPRENATWYEREWKAISSMRQDRKIDEICKQIWRIIPLLTYHHVVSLPIKERGIDPDQIVALSIQPRNGSRRHFMVPDQCDDDFMGREEQLKTITSKISQVGKHVRVAIVGLGGIGKSRLALQCANQYKASGISVFWIYAGSADRMRNRSRDIAKTLGIPGSDDANADALQLLREWFQSEESGTWLLIYDNVDDMDLVYPEDQSGLSSFFPKSPRGSILMTTRNWQVGARFAQAKNTFRITALTIPESMALIAAKLEDDISEAPGRKRLAETLEGIPLALVQACSFIQENMSFTIDRYLALYEASDKDKVWFLSQKFEDDTRDSDSKNPIATTWTVTFEYLKEHRRLAANTLCMMSVFDPRAVPESFVSKTAQGDPANAKNVELALSTLQAYSLISERDSSDTPPGTYGRSYDLHRLIWLSTRNWLTMSASYDFWVAEAIDMMSTKYDEIKEADYDTNWNTKSALLPHALALMSSPQLLLLNDDVSVPTVFQGQVLQDDHAIKGRICPSCIANILTEMLSRNKSWVQKLRMTRKAIAITSHALGPNHVLTLNHRWNEARASWRLEEGERSDLAFRSIIEGYTSTLGPNHVETLRTRRFLAETLNDQGKLKESEQILREVIEVSSREHGQRHQLTTQTMQSLSTNLGLQGRNEEATAMNFEISNLSKDMNSRYVPWIVQLMDLGTPRYKMSKNYVSLFEYVKAEEICLQMLNDREALGQDEYVSVDKVWQTMGKIYRKQRLYDKAEQILLQALAYRRSVYGENSRLTLYTKLYLADVYYNTARYLAAETIQLSAIEPLSTHLGASNSEVLEVRWDLAWTWLKQGKKGESQALALEVTAEVLKTRGEQSQQYITMVQDLSRAWGVSPDGSAVAARDGAGAGERQNWREVHRMRSRSADAHRHDLRTL